MAMEKIKSVAEAEKVLAESSTELAAAESKGDKSGKAKALIRQANALMVKGNVNSAIPRAQTAADLFAELKDQKSEAGALQTLAAAQGSSGYIDDAAENAQKALDTFVAMKDKAGEAAAMNTLASAYLQMWGKSGAAIENAKSAIDLFTQLGDGEAASGALSTAVQALLTEGQVGEAGKLCKNKMTDFKNAKDTAAELGAMYTAVQLNIAKDDPGSAVRAAKDGCKRASELGDKALQGKFAASVAELSMSLKNYDDAKSFATQAIGCLKAQGESTVAMEQLITNVYSIKGEAPPDSESRKNALAILQGAVPLLQAKDGFAFRDSMDKLAKTCGVTESDVLETMGDTIAQDPEGSEAFLLKFGGSTFLKDADSPKKEVPGKIFHSVQMLDFHQAIYFMFSSSGMGFGPRFQGIKMAARHPGSKDDHSFAYNVNRIPSGSAAWEQRVGFHPGILDAGLQSGFIFAPYADQLQNLGKEMPVS